MATSASGSKPTQDDIESQEDSNTKNSIEQVPEHIRHILLPGETVELITSRRRSAVRFSPLRIRIFVGNSKFTVECIYFTSNYSLYFLLRLPIDS
jgi:hypothetical protein